MLSKVEVNWVRAFELFPQMQQNLSWEDFYYLLTIIWGNPWDEGNFNIFLTTKLEPKKSKFNIFRSFDGTANKHWNFIKVYLIVFYPTDNPTYISKLLLLPSQHAHIITSFTDTSCSLSYHPLFTLFNLVPSLNATPHGFYEWHKMSILRRSWQCLFTLTTWHLTFLFTFSFIFANSNSLQHAMPSS